MLTFRNELALGVFLFGTTYLWLTPPFAGPTARGALWSVVQVMALLAIVAFSGAAWGLFRQADWWEPLAICAAVVGMASVVPYWIAVQQLELSDTLSNSLIHFVGGALILIALLTPPAERWIASRL
jgi:lipoprotein signal peptidase